MKEDNLDRRTKKRVKRFLKFFRLKLKEVNLEEFSKNKDTTITLVYPKEGITVQQVGKAKKILGRMNARSLIFLKPGLNGFFIFEIK